MSIGTPNWWGAISGARCSGVPLTFRRPPIRWMVALVVSPAVIGAQTRNDSTNVVATMVNYLVHHPDGAGLATPVKQLIVDTGTASFAGVLARRLRDALPDSVAPASDSLRYYALHLRVDSVLLGASNALVWATWSQCHQNMQGEVLNWSAHPIEYTLVPIDRGWVMAGQFGGAYADGTCPVYRRRS